jgi:hypothetical protein
MTVRHLSLPDSADVEVSSRLLSKFGLEHDIVTEVSNANDGFLEIFKKSLPLAHDVWAPDAQAIFEYYNQRKVAVVGSASEVARCFYRLPRNEEQEITPRGLSLLTAMGDNPFPIKFFGTWLSGLGEIYNFNILDLLYWEQRAGNWLAMCQLEFGMAWQDIFSPYNCRSLLIDMLSVDEEYRRPPKYRLYKELILNLWPEVLCEPINPHKKKGLKHLKRYCKSYIRHQLKKLKPFIQFGGAR